MWFVDSNSNGCMGYNSGWGCVEPSQVKWFEEEMKKVNEKYGTNILHLAFIHIPLPEMVEMYNEGEVYGMR